MRRLVRLSAEPRGRHLPPVAKSNIIDDDVPDHREVDPVVFVPQKIADPANVRPWLVGSKGIDQTFQLARRLRNSRKTPLDRVPASAILTKRSKV
jgi:hypothetical protein